MHTFEIEEFTIGTNEIDDNVIKDFKLAISYKISKQLVKKRYYPYLGLQIYTLYDWEHNNPKLSGFYNRSLLSYLFEANYVQGFYYGVKNS